MLKCFKLTISHKKLLNLLEAVAVALVLILANCLHACSLPLMFSSSVCLLMVLLINGLLTIHLKCL